MKAKLRAKWIWISDFLYFWKHFYREVFRDMILGREKIEVLKRDVEGIQAVVFCKAQNGSRIVSRRYRASRAAREIAEAYERRPRRESWGFAMDYERRDGQTVDHDTRDWPEDEDKVEITARELAALYLKWERMNAGARLPGPARRGSFRRHTSSVESAG